MHEIPPIPWPSYYHPDNAQLHIKSEASLLSNVETVWHSLTHAACWPSWKFSNTSVQILNGDGLTLHKGSVFVFKTKTRTYKCTVVQYKENEFIAWKGRIGSADVYHAWLLTPNTQGCTITSEVTQRGGMTRFTKFFSANGLKRYNENWLKEICKQSME
ncbi:SRPBCC family protein [Vibrio celticus]|uniref:Polyketide cyclase / dehydrase and lipid transport n=1 Tax=Vibrio celticus TaxID=446372 RepID=A0A1C3JKJ6_9VIBR|nr:SRPBCC family protein [Vibrio celticus]SBT15597.1 Polyketide cyclase / dehydrase and lipid transport [Vibrio celticus]